VADYLRLLARGCSTERLVGRRASALRRELGRIRKQLLELREQSRLIDDLAVGEWEREQGQHDGRQYEKGRDSRHERLPSRMMNYPGGRARRSNELGVATRAGVVTATTTSAPLGRVASRPPRKPGLFARAGGRVKLSRHAPLCSASPRRGVACLNCVRAARARTDAGPEDGAREEAARRQGAQVSVLDTVDRRLGRGQDQVDRLD